MSTGRQIHSLVVEDESLPADSYRQMFEALSTDFPLGRPKFARSYSDAVQELERPMFYHVVILDLSIPMRSGDLPENLEPGMNLLEKCALRFDYPVPVLLIISGKLNLTSQHELRSRLDRDFFCGRMIVKGIDTIDELRDAFAKALEYIEVGIHLHETSSRQLPLTPVEDDLLRRSLVKMDALGVDAKWWRCLDRSTSQFKANVTKVLMGHFILRNDAGISLPTFFKFEPSENAEFSRNDTLICFQKLKHVKLMDCVVSRTRALLVTQSVSGNVPMQLDEYFTREGSADELAALAKDIVEQLDALDSITDESRTLCSLLWGHHDLQNIFLHNGGVPGLGPEVVVVLKRIQASTSARWTKWRRTTHGDLTPSNVAITVSPSGPQAFIFDAAGTRGSSPAHDLAFLEVAILIAVPIDPFELSRVLPNLYPEGSFEVRKITSSNCSAINVVEFVSNLRTEADRIGGRLEYAILLFDSALLYLGAALRKRESADPSSEVGILNRISLWLQSLNLQGW